MIGGTTAGRRFGILRPARAGAGRVVSVAESRVVVAELSRRVAAADWQVRQEGPAAEAWPSIEDDPWPDGVVPVELGLLWNPATPPLTTLFHRTVDPVAAEVRRRMLRQLCLLDPNRPIDRDALAELDRYRLSATDMWLLIVTARSVEFDDRSLAGFRADPADPEVAELDAVFDSFVGRAGRS